jgi:hypothetical protein
MTASAERGDPMDRLFFCPGMPPGNPVVPVIYSHFENKAAILLEFSKKGFQLLAENLTRDTASRIPALAEFNQVRIGRP